MFRVNVVNENGRDVLQMDDVRLTYKNFTGVGSAYNREGDRGFSIIIPDMETAQELMDMGWKVKIKAPREEGDLPFIHMPIKVKFNGRGPNIYLRSGNKEVLLSEDTVECLDRISMKQVDLDIRPYDWERPDGSSGRSSYLSSMYVVQEIDRFQQRMAEEEYPCDE